MFIAVEGIDGAGKTTVARKLCTLLAKEFPERSVEFIRAPDGPIRDILLNRPDYTLDAQTEVLLFLAGHRWLLTNKIFPALKRGAIVVMDRFTDTTISYQGAGRCLDIDRLTSLIAEQITYGYSEKQLYEQLNPRQAMRMSSIGVRPDHTVYISAPRSLSEERIKARGNLDFMDQEGVSFRDRVARQMRILKNDHEIDYLKGHCQMGISEISNVGTIEALDATLDAWVTELRGSIVSHLADMEMSSETPHIKV